MLHLSRRRVAFTLVELLVVIAIIAIVLSIATYAIQKVRAQALLTQCGNNLRQIGFAIQAYEDKNGCYPHGRLGCDGTDAPTLLCANQTDAQRTGLSGFAQILPYTDGKTVFDQLNKNDWPWSQTSTWRSAPSNLAAIQMTIPVYRCPMDPSSLVITYGGVQAATNSYALVHGSLGPSQGIDSTWKVRNNGMFAYRLPHTKSDMTDGASNTYFVGEVLGADDSTHSVNIWSNTGRHESCLRSTENPLNTTPGTGITTAPYGIPLSGSFGSYHNAGGNFLYGDGHVVFTSNSIPLATYRALSTRAGNDVILP